MVRIVTGALGLAAMWLLMSGLWDKPLILIFGVFSVFLSIWIMLRIDAADGERLAFTISPFATAKYLVWLLVEVAKSNWAVSKIILSGKDPENQRLIWIPVTQKGDVGQVVFANSITLTPGTVTVETEGDCFLVHALDFNDEDMSDFEEMDRRVTAIETDDAGAGV